MGPLLQNHPALVGRPATRDRPSTRDHGDHSLIVPSRTSSLHSRITQPPASSLNLKVNYKTPKTLTHAYLVCGIAREPSHWVKAPLPPHGKITHTKGGTGQFWLPEILGSSPRLEQDNEIARALYAAMRACFPHDAEVCTGRVQPPYLHHSFVLQQDSSHTLYGIALRVWSRLDQKRTESAREMRKKHDPDYHESPDEIYWVPYCLSFLSRYPLYDLLGDYLRGMWIHWNKATNLFHAEEVSRILNFPAPKLSDLVRIDMKDYALCYKFPSTPNRFQNFALWPLFTCLSIPNIVGVIEAAVSATRRIIFTSHHPAMLTVATETVRYFVRGYEWSGLYVPIVYARHAKDLVQEPGPYMLGITAECKSLYIAPADALVIDLDRNFVLTSSPPAVLSAGQRVKMTTRLTQALDGEVTPSGPPSHLRVAYVGGKLVPAGQIIVMRGEVETVEDPSWWNQANVMAVMDHVCEKLVGDPALTGPRFDADCSQGRNTKMKAVFGGSVKKPLMTKVSVRHLNEIIRERNQYSRDAMDAWQDFITFKGRMDNDLARTTKRNNFLNDELESWKQQFLKFQAFAEALTKETQELKVKIESHKRENRRLTLLIDQQKDDAARLTIRLSGTEKQRDDALEALVLQQEIAEELERERKRNAKALAALQHTNSTLARQRDESQRVVLHLRSLINGQTHHMEHIVRSLNTGPELASYIAEGYDDAPDDMDDHGSIASSENMGATKRLSLLRSGGRGSRSRASTVETDSKAEGDQVSPEMENRFFSSLLSEKSGRASRLSFADVADRHLRDKTDAIADIIRNISEQCAAAVEGLQLAQDAELEQDLDEKKTSQEHVSPSEDGHDQSIRTDSEAEESSFLSPTGNRRHSSIPSTPDLVHNRSSTSMSMVSSNIESDRLSQHYGHSIDLRTKIVEHDDEISERGSMMGMGVENSNAKMMGDVAIRPVTARIV